MQRTDVNKQIEFYCEKNANQICPFSLEKCKKIVRSDLGVCSFFHKNSNQIICPNVFSRSSFIELISNKFLHTTNIEIYKEVKIGNNFIDYIIMDKIHPTNIVAIELQALDTSGNYKWVFGAKAKPFCINWKTTKKTILSQLVSKVSIFKKISKKVALVIQNTFFDYLKFKKNKFDETKDFHILTYQYENEGFINPTFYSYEFDELIDALVDNERIDLDDLVSNLIGK